MRKDRRINLRAEQVHGQVHIARPRSARFEAAEGLIHRSTDLLDSRRPDAPLGDGSENGFHVTQLMEIFTVHVHRAAGELAGEQEHRRRVGVRLPNRCERVGHAGTRNRQTHSGSACRAGVTVGHVSRPLFVAREDELDFRTPKRIE